MSRREDRRPPVPLRVIYRLPPGSALLYLAASAEGRAMRSDGTFDRLNGEQPLGVRVARVHRDRVLENLSLSHGRWRQAVREWVSLGVAHRCGPNEVFLLLQAINSWKPETSECPYCQNVTLSNARTSLSVTPPVTDSDATTHESGDATRGTEGGWGASKPELDRLVATWGDIPTAYRAAAARFGVDSIAYLSSEQVDELLAVGLKESNRKAAQEALRVDA